MNKFVRSIAALFMAASLLVVGLLTIQAQDPTAFRGRFYGGMNGKSYGAKAA